MNLKEGEQVSFFKQTYMQLEQNYTRYYLTKTGRSRAIDFVKLASNEVKEIEK